MTREQADNILESIDVIEGCNTGYLCRDVENLIAKIYDELEPNSCEGCIHHKAYDGNFALSCCECSRFYSDNFEAKSGI